jgi:hypothetical protein
VVVASTVSIRRRGAHHARCQAAAGATAIFDDELAYAIVAELLRNQAGNHVSDTTGSERDDERHRLRRIGLRSNGLRSSRSTAAPAAKCRN